MTLPRSLQRILVICGLALYALALAEICVRVLDPLPLMPRYITGTPWGVRGNIPGANYRHKTPEVEVYYHINNQGMRAEHDYPLQKPAGTCRIGMIGDSFFVGYELAYEDTIARQLELELLASGLRAEVLNFAVSGFGTAEMLRTYEAQMRRFSPDVVLLQWHESDLDDNPRSGLYKLEKGQLVKGDAQYLPSVGVQDALMKWRLYRLIADHSQFYAWVREHVAVIVKDVILRMRGGATTAAATPAAGGPPSYAAILSAELLRKFRSEVLADGRALLVVDMPASISRSRMRSSWSQLPPDRVADIPVLHADSVFLPLMAPDRKLFYERGLGHITPLAARALAIRVASELRRALTADNCNTRSDPG